MGISHLVLAMYVSVLALQSTVLPSSVTGGCMVVSPVQTSRGGTGSVTNSRRTDGRTDQESRAQCRLFIYDLVGWCTDDHYSDRF